VQADADDASGAVAEFAGGLGVQGAAGLGDQPALVHHLPRLQGRVERGGVALPAGEGQADVDGRVGFAADFHAADVGEQLSEHRGGFLGLVPAVVADGTGALAQGGGVVAAGQEAGRADLASDPDELGLPGLGRHAPPPIASKSPLRAPPTNACHSWMLNRRTGPSGSRLLRTPISPPRSATCMQLPLAKLSELFTQLVMVFAPSGRGGRGPPGDGEGALPSPGRWRPGAPLPGAGSVPRAVGVHGEEPVHYIRSQPDTPGQRAVTENTGALRWIAS
jgi:hypothetical protein